MNKKIIFLISILMIGSLTYAENEMSLKDAFGGEVEKQEVNLEKQLKEDSKTELPTPTEETENNMQEPEFTKVEKKDGNYYYDKTGKLIARDKNINGVVFFYNSVNQHIGKSVERKGKTYYYSPIGKFLGVCDDTGCLDNNFFNIGKVPPLPKVEQFTPVLNQDVLNPQQKQSALDD